MYLEPGEACALNAGYLATRVLDIIKNGSTNIAILDTSAACHMPDVLEMPYRPPLYGAGDAAEKVIPAVWAAKPALREMLSAITALTRRLAKAIRFCLAIWQFTLPAKTIPLTACRCLPFIHIRHQGSLS